MGKFRQLSQALWPLIVSTLYLEHFLTDFLQTCIRVDIRKEWFGIIDG